MDGWMDRQMDGWICNMLYMKRSISKICLYNLTILYYGVRDLMKPLKSKSKLIFMEIIFIIPAV